MTIHRVSLDRSSAFVPVVLLILILAAVPSGSAADALSLRSAAEGGKTMAIHVSGGYAYTGVANVLVVRDISNPTSPAEVADRVLGGDVRSIASLGNTLYVAASEGGVCVFDISAPATPVEVTTVSTPGSAVGLALAGSHAYVADGLGGLRILDVSSPQSPVEVASEITSANVTAVYVDGGYAYLAGEVALLVLDVSTPTAPAVSGSFDQTAHSQAVAVDGNYAFLVVDIHLQAIDVTNKTNPVFADAGLVDQGMGLALSGGHAFVPGQSGMRIFDVSDPTNITLAGAVLARSGFDVAIDGSLAHVAQGLDGFDIHDVADVANPQLVFDGNRGWDEGIAVALFGDHAFVAADLGLLKVVDVSDANTLSEVGNMEFIPTNFPLSVTAVAATSGYAYVAQAPGGLGGVDGVDIEIIDVSDPSNPVDVGTYNDAFNLVEINTMQAVGSYLYTAKGFFGMRVYDITNPLVPVSLANSPTSGRATDLVVDGNTVYLLDGAPTLGLRVLDTTNFGSITEVGTYWTPGVATAAALDAPNHRLYIADEGNGLIVLDVTNPANPSKLGELSLPTITDVAAAGDVVYVADNNVIQSIDVSDPTSPVAVDVFDRTSGGELQVMTRGDDVFVLERLAGLYALGSDPVASGIGDTPIASERALEQNEPNPFNPTTTIRYTVAQGGRVHLEVFDVSGRLVRTLADGNHAAHNERYAVTWDGRDNAGEAVASGVYFYRLIAPAVRETRKMVLLK